MLIYTLLLLSTWQQQLSYKIKASLNTSEHTLEATEYVTYYNNSPDPLETLYFHLYPNAYRDNSTVFARESKKLGDYKYINAGKKDRGYVEISSVNIADIPLKYIIDETIMTVVLNRSLVPGDSLELKIDFVLKIPKIFSRLGYQGNHYEMVQWYPKPCVYDHIGWHLDSYHAIGEFYGEFGNFEVELELPAGYVVAATGERTDSIKIKMPQRKIVSFHAENVHDFAWVCDPDFLVDRYDADGIAIDVFYTKKDKKKWTRAGEYSVDAVTRYNQWFGQYSYRTLSVVDGCFAGGMEYPNLVIIGMDEDFLTTNFEMVIIHEIGHQWFYAMLGSNEMDEAWLDEGFTTYAEIRYFEDKYGHNNSLFKLPFLPPLSKRYFHKLVYYITQTNQLEGSILGPSYRFIDIPLGYMNAAYSKPGLFLINLEGVLGRDVFDRILKGYFERYIFKHPSTDDFIGVCEEISNQDLKPVFDRFLKTTDYCDWYVKSIKNGKIEVANHGNALMPVDVFVETDLGGQVYRIDAKDKIGIIDYAPGKKIRKIVIDPYGYSLESNYWNNYFPRRLDIKPIMALPSFDAYQIFYIPYLWYDTDDGFTPGLYLFGSEFADFDFVKGKNQFMIGAIYGLSSKIIYPSIIYQTPIVFKKGFRSRINLKASNSSDGEKAKFGFMTNLGMPFAFNRLSIEMRNEAAYYKLSSFVSVDSIDWTLGQNNVFENFIKFGYRRWEVVISTSLAGNILNGEYHYVKTTLEVKKTTQLIVPLCFRIFAGRVFGSAPNQEKLFLSGALRISQIADLLFSQKGYFSPQEHLHIPGDGNMLGYQTKHIKTDQLYCINLELPGNLPVRLFGDLGYYYDDSNTWQTAYDFGAKLAIGPVSFNLPLFTKDKPWSLYWTIGF